MEKKHIYVISGIISGVIIGIGVMSANNSNDSNRSWLDDMKGFDSVSNNCNTKPWLSRDSRCVGR